MASEVKRMRYFDGLFLKEEEFQLDQEYNLRQRRLHNRHLHGCGIVWGLDVELGPTSSQVVVRQGMAIDKYFDTDNAEEVGREILVPQDTTLNVTGAANSSVYLFVYYAETQADVVAELGGTEPIHWLENATLEFATSRPADEEESLILARIDIKNDGTIDANSIVFDEAGLPLRKILEPPTGDTIIQSGGEGKNYVQNPSAETDTADWTSAASGELSVSTTIAAGEVLAGTQSFRVNSTSSVSADTDYVTVGLNDLDEEDTNQLLAVEFSYKGLVSWDNGHLKVVVRDTANNVDIVPNPSLVPGGQGKFRGVFTASDSTAYELRLVAGVDATPFLVAIDSVRVSPDKLTIGPAISGWTPYDLQITATTTDPVKATAPDVDQARWRRVGDSMEITYTYRHTNNAGSSAGSGVYLFSIPAGYTIDSSKLVVSSEELSGVVGSATADLSVGDAPGDSAGVVKAYDATNLALLPLSDATQINYNYVSGANFHLNYATAGYSFRATVPIAEWQSDVVLTESRTEYVYNSDTSNGDNSSSFGTGEIGGLVPNVPIQSPPATALIRKRCRVSRPYKHYRLEFSIGGNNIWTDDKFRPQFFQGTSADQNYSGAYIDPISDTEFDVIFQGNAHTAAESAGTVGWDAEYGAGTRWRVVASDNPFFVESTDTKPVSAIGQTINHGPVTILATGTNPVKGTPVADELRSRRIGDHMELTFMYYQNAAGSAGSGAYLFPLPDGLTIDGSKCIIATVPHEATELGTGRIMNTAPEGGYTVRVHAYDSKHLGLEYTGVGALGNYTDSIVNNANSGLHHTVISFTFRAVIPIAEWTHDVVLRESLTEYAFNTDTADADDTTSFATGENGGIVPSLIGGGAGYGDGKSRKKRVQFSRPFKHVALEFDESGRGTWSSTSKFTRHLIFDRAVPGFQFYGAHLEQVPGSSTEWDVKFYGNAYQSDPGTITWTDEANNGTRYRVVGSDNPFFVEALAPIEAGDVGPWTSAGPIVFRGTSTDPIPGPTVANEIRYRRVGESMEISGQFQQSSNGTQGSGEYIIEIPEGLHASAAAVSSVGQGGNAWGSGQIHETTVAGMTVAVALYDNRHLRLQGEHPVSTWVPFLSAQWTFNTGNTFYVSFHATIPIDEWANSDLVLRDNRTEYVYNTSTANADDTTSFATGESGGAVPLVASTDKKTRVRFSRAFKHYRLEFQENGIGPWLAAGDTRFGLIRRGDGNSGMDGAGLIPVNETDLDVIWTQAGATIAFSATATNTWTLENSNGTKWRVVGSDNPLFVESGDAIDAGDVGPWTNAGAMTVQSFEATDPTPSASVTHNTIQYRRVGEAMEVIGSYHHTAGGTDGSGTYCIDIPEGLHAAGIINFNGTSGAENTVGSAQIHDENVVGATGVVQLLDNRRFTFLVNKSIGSYTLFDSANVPFSSPILKFSFRATIPIAEWTNTDLVLRENQTEYVYNTSTANADDTSSFATGQEGALIPPIDTTEKGVRVQFSREFRHVRLEVKPSGAAWIDIGATQYKHHVISANNYGMYLRAVAGSNRQFDVVFSKNGHHIPEFSNPPWSTETAAGTRWRVVGTDNPLAVETPDIMQGNVIGPWTHAGEIQFSGSVSDPVPGPTAVNEIRYRRVGESMEIAGQFQQTSAGTQGSGVFLIRIPEGLRATADAVHNTGLGVNTWGSAQVHEGTVDAAQGTVQLWDATHFTLAVVDTAPAAGTSMFESAKWTFATANDFYVSFHATIPIDEWSGGNNVILAENDTEFVSNSNTTNIDDTVSFATGESGSLVPNSAGTDGTFQIRKRCRVSRPFKHFRLEFNSNGNTFWTAEKFGVNGWHEAGVFQYYGAFIDPISPTEFDVVFQGWAHAVTTSTAWATEHTAGTTWRVVCSDNPALVESPEPQQGNVVGPWTNAGPIVWRGSTTDPIPGTTAVNQLHYRRVGDSMEIAGQYRQTAAGTNGSGNYYFEIPEGLHVAAHANPNLGLPTNDPAEDTLGTAQIHEHGTLTGGGVVQIWNDRNLTLITSNSGAGGSMQFFGSGIISFGTSNSFDISFRATIPIDEWQSDVVLAESRIEFASNSDTSNADDLTSFTGGESGSPVPLVTTSNKKKRVRFSRPFKHYRVEVSEGGTGAWWEPNELVDSGVRYGIRLHPVSDTEMDVHFYSGGTTRANPWPTANSQGDLWRVVGSDNPLLVESPEPYQGNVVGPWTNVGPIVIKGATTDAVLGAMEYNYLKYRRVGETMEVEGGFHSTGAGTGGSGNYYIEIPEGLHAVDEGNFAAGAGYNSFGNSSGNVPGLGHLMGSVQLIDNRSISFLFDDETQFRFFSSTNVNITQSNVYLSFQAKIPIAEWQSTDIVLSESRVEYAANSDPANADDTTNFVSGESGALVPTVSGSDKKKRVRLSREFKHVRLEVSPQGNAWVDVAVAGYAIDDNNSGAGRYGMQLHPISATEFDVYFSQFGMNNMANTDTWATENSNGTRWRVVGSDNPALVQAPQAQYLAATSDPLTGFSNNVRLAMTNNFVVLQPGAWSVSGVLQLNSPGASAQYTAYGWNWSSTPGDNTSGFGSITPVPLEAGLDSLGARADGQQFSQTIGPVRIRVAVATTVYLVPIVEATVPANGEVITHIYAERLE